MASWREVVAVSRPLTVERNDGDEDEEVTCGVAKPLPIIVWGREAKKRRILPMPWGFPHPKDWRKPQPIHARSETIDTTKAFAGAFAAEQRGVVVFKTFNDGEEVTNANGNTKTVQWTIDPQDGQPRGFAFVWRRFEIAELPHSAFACVTATVPANKLLRETILKHDPDARIPAILEDADWATWLGEKGNTAGEAKEVLRTMEGVKWSMRRSERRRRRRSRRTRNRSADCFDGRGGPN
jgi:putative SOS response-associated peptidase YedK